MLKLNISHLLKAGLEKLSMFWVIQLNLYCKSVLDYICVTRPDSALVLLAQMQTTAVHFFFSKQIKVVAHQHHKRERPKFRNQSGQKILDHSDLLSLLSVFCLCSQISFLSKPWLVRGRD